MNEKEIMNNAIDELQTLFNQMNMGFKYEMEPKNSYYDILGKLSYRKKQYKLLIEIRSKGEPREIKKFIGTLDNNSLTGYPLLVAPYISELGRKICIKNNINYIDLSGNAFIKIDGILIDRWGRENKFKKKRNLRSLFASRSTVIIRSMLNDPKRPWTIQDLADESKTSIGQVYKVIEKLDSLGLLERKWGSIVLTKPGDLLDLWKEAYSYKDLKMKGYYCPFEDRNELFNKLKQIKNQKYALTMGAGASIIAPFVRTNDFHIYTPTPDLFIMLLELTEVEFGGNLYLIEPPDQGFLKYTQEKDQIKIVSNNQLYLDLYSYPKRGREQADFLRENIMEY